MSAEYGRSVYQPQSESLVQSSGSITYNIEGTKINIPWQEFLPRTPTQPLDSSQGVIVIPGFGSAYNALQTVDLGQEFANASGIRTLTVDPRTEPGPYSHLKEAKAIRQFISDQGITNDFVVGQSHGGAIGISTAVSEQTQGLVLINSMGLYEQGFPSFLLRYAVDMFYKGQWQPYPPQIDFGALLDRKKTMDKEAKEEMWKQIWLAGGFHRYPGRILSEVNGMLKENIDAREVTAPVVIIHGKRDLLSQLKGIVPKKGEKNRYIEDPQERIAHLKKKFAKSKNVAMVIVDKLGHHGLASFRPKDVARNAWYLLERSRRVVKEQIMQPDIEYDLL